MAVFRLFIPKQTVGANLVHFDLFHGTGSGQQLHLVSVLPVNSGAVAHTGVVTADLHLTRTTDVGTGGTAATREGVALDAATISCQDGQAPCPAVITARLTPTGGATAGAWLSWRSIRTEETTSNAGEIVTDMVNNGNPHIPAILVRPGSGIRVAQGSVASTGTVGFDVIFTLTPTN
jgi:hypothetical protein